ncbi:MAG: cytochrome C, partial [Candidatus Hydrothermae bacterium]|nr:cytochrome C [Candidatus Hydrothermae bacterium]
YIVHSEEALLAVGFIVLFHFFHNHLRPENFPMDLSIFTGRIPLERFKRERPEEYQRRVEAGTLEEILVDAPSPCHLRIARTVGWLALVSGLVLMVGILAALWAHRPLG